MSYSLEEKIKHFAIYSRVGIIILQFLANYFIPDHDARVFQKPENPDERKTFLDAYVDSMFGGLTRWDGQYFLHISHYGYTYENTVAFFPLFPLIVRQLSNLVLYIVNEVLINFLPFRNIISTHSVHILVSVLFNNIIFVKTATILYKLSCVVLESEKLAYISAVLFCVNPASIFFSACYSESLYCFLIFYGMLKIEQKNALVNYIVIGMTGAVRSNGIVNVGFVIYKYIKQKCTQKAGFLYGLIFNFGLILSLLPFLSYQLYCFAKFCFPHKVSLPDFIYEHGFENKYVFPGGNSSWCSQIVPFAYGYVQNHYWKVGFLKYYKIKQIPNFLLAVPIIVIIFRGTWDFVKHHKFLILYLGLVKGDSNHEIPISAFPYVLHGFALTVFSIFFIHIQVVTRLLLSSSPLPFWFCARVLSSSLKNPVEADILQKFQKKDDECYYESHKNKKSRWKTFLVTETFCGYSFFIKWYFLVYFFVGTLAFSNYLPWT